MSLLRAFLKGQFGLGQICSSSKPRVLGGWNGIPCPCQGAGGCQVFSVCWFCSLTCIQREEKVQWQHLSRSRRFCVRTKCWLGRCLQIPSQGCSEHSLDLRTHPFPTGSSTIQRLCHSGEDSDLVMDVFVCLMELSWWTTFMRACAHARDVCSDSLSSHTAQSSEQDGVRPHFSVWKPKTAEQHKSWSARRKPSLWEEPVCYFHFGFLL